MITCELPSTGAIAITSYKPTLITNPANFLELRLDRSLEIHFA